MIDAIPVVDHQPVVNQQPALAHTRKPKGVLTRFGRRKAAAQPGRETRHVNARRGLAEPNQLHLVADLGVRRFACELHVGKKLGGQPPLATLLGLELASLDQGQHLVDGAADLITDVGAVSGMALHGVQGCYDIVGRDVGAAAALDLRPPGILANDGNGPDRSPDRGAAARRHF